MEPPVDVELAPAAMADIEHAASYLGHENPAVAEALLGAIGKMLERLAAAPEIGPRVLSLGPGEVRAVTIPRFRTYRVFYWHDVNRNRLRVLRVLHGARDWPDLLDQ